MRMVSCAWAGPIETMTISVARPFSFDADGLLDGDLVERVHRHLDVGEVHAGLVGLHAGTDVVIDHPFNGYEHLHRWVSG